MSRQFKILVQVVDKTQKPLEDVQKRLKKTKDEAKKATVNLTQFNRGLFAATAVAGTFVKAFTGVGRAITEGTDFERLGNQVTRAIGPYSKFLDSISQITDVAIDKNEAMASALKLANLGISRDGTQIANILAKAAVAAKMAGKDTSVGMNEIVEALASGNIASAKSLQLISESNVGYKIQQAMLGKVGGALGGVIAMQHRLGVIQALLDARTKGQLKGYQDLKDVLGVLRSEYDYLRKEFGILLGKAVLPLAKGLTELVMKTRQIVQTMKENKQIVFFAKSLLVASGAVTALLGTFLTLRASMFALTSLGFGLPRLIGLVVGLGSTFIGITRPVKTFVEKLELLGAVFKGIYELVTTLNSETGIAKMSKSTYLLLKQNGLLGFVQFLGRAISVVKTVATDMWNTFKWLAIKIDDIFGGVARNIFKVLDFINTPWSNFWVSESLDPIYKFERSAKVILSGLFAWIAGKKIFGTLSGLLAKVPGLGKLFGEGPGGKGPTGKASDPLYVVMADKALGLLRKIPGVEKAGGWLSSKFAVLLGLLSGKFQDLILKSKILAQIFTHPAGKLKGLLSVLGTFGRSILTVGKTFFTSVAMVGMKIVPAITAMFASLAPLLGPAIAVGAGALIGYGIGTAINSLIDKYTQGKTKEGFEGNILERSLFKTNKFFGGETSKKIMQGTKQMQDFMSKSDAELVNEFRAKKGLPPLTAEQLAKAEEARKPTVPGLDVGMTPMSGNQTAAITPMPLDTELEALNQLGESLQATPNSSALTMQKQYEKMLNEGKKPSEIAAEQLGTKLDDTNYYLEGILKNTMPNRTLQSNPMYKRER